VSTLKRDDGGVWKKQRRLIFQTYGNVLIDEHGKETERQIGAKTEEQVVESLMELIPVS
jgi:hypothetical protein